MTWFKVDDSFHSHPKVLAAEPAALGLWVVAGAWCGANLTDGFVPDYALPRLLPDSAELAQQLVTCGLWRRAKGGYRFHDWGDYNPNSSDVQKERDAARERMRNLRANRKGKGQPVNGSGEHQANVREKFGVGSQPRPDPTRSSSNEELEESAISDRADVERLCIQLADAIAANGNKRPTITEKWRTSARLLIDKDGRTEEQISVAIRWCQADEFWRGNVMSMPKLRQKYDQLRMAALRTQNGRRPAPPDVSPRDEWKYRG